MNATTQQPAHRDAYASPADIEAGQVTGVGYAVSVETGRPIPVYVNDTPPPPPPAPLVPQQPPIVQQVVVHRRQLDPITTRIAAASAGIAGTAWVVGEHAHQLAEAAHAAEGLGIAGAALFAGVALWKGTQPAINVNVSANITGANASSTSSSTSTSDATVLKR